MARVGGQNVFRTWNLVLSRNVLVFNMATLEKSQLFLLLNHAVQFLSPWVWYRALSRGLVDSVFLFTLKLVHLVLVIERGRLNSKFACFWSQILVSSCKRGDLFYLTWFFTWTIWIIFLSCSYFVFALMHCKKGKNLLKKNCKIRYVMVLQIEAHCSTFPKTGPKCFSGTNPKNQTVLGKCHTVCYSI